MCEAEGVCELGRGLSVHVGCGKGGVGGRKWMGELGAVWRRMCVRG